MLTIIEAKNPVYTQSGINVEVLFGEIGEWLCFHASPDDAEEHGRELYRRALAGEFGTVEPYIALVKNEEQLILEIQNAVIEYLNAPARAKLYDSIQSAALRAGYPGPFHDEGVAFATWMDTCWAKCYELLAEVKDGTRPVMSPEEVVAELPVLQL